MSFPVWLEQLGLGDEVEKPESAEVVNEILDSFEERYGVKLTSLMKGGAK